MIRKATLSALVVFLIAVASSCGGVASKAPQAICNQVLRTEPVSVHPPTPGEEAHFYFAGSLMTGLTRSHDSVLKRQGIALSDAIASQNVAEANTALGRAKSECQSLG